MPTMYVIRSKKDPTKFAKILSFSRPQTQWVEQKNATHFTFMTEAVMESIYANVPDCEVIPVQISNEEN